MSSSSKKVKPKDTAQIEIAVKNARVGSSFAIFVDTQARRYTQGQVRASSFSISIPSGFAKSAKLNILEPRTRESRGRLLSIDIDPLESKTVDVSQYIPTPSSLSEEPKSEKGKKLIQNKLQEKVQQAKENAQDAMHEEETTATQEITDVPQHKRNFLENKLREQIQEKKAVDSGTPEANNENGENSNTEEANQDEEGKPKKSFWDRLR
ncbi:hypothetical protein A3A76_00110 [Candidatus Woesebacteria bacterium RIFCSPLOWO2_01_FULL_39_23]|uniref:Uncharacterized protein n=1 Tax=Candidatus Woesebacteria bacterium RIFCSPHIGHO2_01_FULL_40_22 TaxID=1802499 RepID=A0A1F7YG14_9BACT|nr:MAG: hypothetical protein A2141_03030 [Candidatus Woesebacteria bacterium RBG_16_40_11]OGM26286.1 MAG: hypothetical protein A2628_03730 [Candidatus Woesebacteria bacterium RIFCSPHIGHO2_01_FULL_40_22]OGM36653.1 MAG: hypothetical protein A3E41_01955 [Candidatus Woesebacteria bacterium RIFCSPHIGHO2_12_FULL_38_9]OGM62841.1 MAG: hypothetical protein A3A76_00110 [Candidatus Woesebacteria bacterium RIFCSPLOWO2_01_FULL_39_23]